MYAMYAHILIQQVYVDVTSEYRCHHPSIGRKANAASSFRYSLVMCIVKAMQDTRSYLFQHSISSRPF